MGRDVSEEGTEKGTSLVNADNVRCDEIRLRFRHLGEAEFILERIKGDGGPDESRIVANLGAVSSATSQKI